MTDTAYAARKAAERANARKAAERCEDLDWMAYGGETTEGAAARLGISVDALERWSSKHARETWRRLRANDEFYGRTA